MDIKQRFMNAVDYVIEKVKADKNVIALIIQGSLSYDAVWEKSDIDSILVIRDQPLNATSFCLNVDDIPFNIQLVERSKLKRYWEKSFDGSIHHSFITTCQIVYTNDNSLYDYLEDLKKVGKDDLMQSSMGIATHITYCLEKCQKWLIVKNNPQYAQFWILKASEAIANMIICLNYETPNREAVLRAKEINPTIMKQIYDIPLSKSLNFTEVEETIKLMESYLASTVQTFSKPILDYLEDGEVKTLSVMAKYFKTDSHSLFHLLDYLCDKEIIIKVSEIINITPKSRKILEEMAFIKVPDQF